MGDPVKGMSRVDEKGWARGAGFVVLVRDGKVVVHGEYFDIYFLPDEAESFGEELLKAAARVRG